MKRRLLPEAAYDFFVVDGRDGETWGPFDTLDEAKRNARSYRRTHPLAGAAIRLEHEVNERKVLRLLAEPPRGRDGEL